MSFENFSQIPPNDSRRPMYNLAGITSGSSVLGIRYKDGVMIAADTLVTYGNEKTYSNMQRVYKMNENLVLGGSGDYPDFQHIRALVENKIIEDFCFQDPNHLKPSMLTCWLTTKLYERRVEKKPLSFDAVVGGIENNGTPYLAVVDHHGGYIDDYMAATGPAIMGLAMISGRKPADREFTAIEAAELIENVMMVLFYRDTASVNTYQVGICSRTKCDVVGPFKVNESWSVAEICHGY